MQKESIDSTAKPSAVTPCSNCFYVVHENHLPSMVIGAMPGKLSSLTPYWTTHQETVSEVYAREQNPFSLFNNLRHIIY